MAKANTKIDPNVTFIRSLENLIYEAKVARVAPAVVIQVLSGSADFVRRESVNQIAMGSHRLSRWKIPATSRQSA
jgi:hypothetical protein